MRLKRNRLQTYYHKAAILKKDNEGNTFIEYGRPVSFKAEMWAAGGKLQSELYGLRLPNIRNLRLEGAYKEISGKNGKLSYEVDGGPEITVNDGICINVSGEEGPDYKVVAIYPYHFLTLEVERL